MSTIKVRVLYFAVLRDATGLEAESLEIPSETTVSRLLDHVKRLHPGASEMVDRALVARNREYVDGDSTLEEGDTIALIPPVSGGRIP